MGKYLKVKKNLVFNDEGSWAVELFEYNDGTQPMYSYFDSFKTKKQAIEIAKILNMSSYLRIRDKLMDNPNYLA